MHEQQLAAPFERRSEHGVIGGIAFYHHPAAGEPGVGEGEPGVGGGPYADAPGGGNDDADARQVSARQFRAAFDFDIEYERGGFSGVQRRVEKHGE